jgi:hypothetical protein
VAKRLKRVFATLRRAVSRFGGKPTEKPLVLGYSHEFGSFDASGDRIIYGAVERVSPLVEWSYEQPLTYPMAVGERGDGVVIQGVGRCKQ